MRPGCSGDYHREDVRPCCSLYRPSSPTRGVLIAPLYYRPARVLTRLRALCDGSSEKQALSSPRHRTVYDSTDP